MQFRVAQKPLYKINDRFYDKEKKQEFVIVGFYYDFIAKGFYYIAIVGEPKNGEEPQQFRLLEYQLRHAIKEQKIRKVDNIR